MTKSQTSPVDLVNSELHEFHLNTNLFFQIHLFHLFCSLGPLIGSACTFPPPLLEKTQGFYVATVNFNFSLYYRVTQIYTCSCKKKVIKDSWERQRLQTRGLTLCLWTKRQPYTNWKLVKSRTLKNAYKLSIATCSCI